MASGDAQRTWFPELIEALSEAWSPLLSEPDWMALRDRLDALLQAIRTERDIAPCMV